MRGPLQRGKFILSSNQEMPTTTRDVYGNVSEMQVYSIQNKWKQRSTLVFVSHLTSNCCTLRVRCPASWLPRNQGKQWQPGSSISSYLPNLSLIATVDWSTCTQHNKLPISSLSCRVADTLVLLVDSIHRNKKYMDFSSSMRTYYYKSNQITPNGQPVVIPANYLSRIIIIFLGIQCLTLRLITSQKCRAKNDTKQNTHPHKKAKFIKRQWKGRGCESVAVPPNRID